ncbi:GIY-YIG nuclease family protein [Subtercola sp. YIM 133946]|uniref:GIY-YIG nuclease family protein n=1 Tax=Subtercola sp. YIM 133946 TaxID=3118909 RepID=UPI002F93EBF5
MCKQTLIYIMILDDYKQAYIGQSVNLRRRIKGHWAGMLQFDRLLWGQPHESVLGIDVFRPLDTTRFYAAKTRNGYDLEEKLVGSIRPDYLLNRIGGGQMFGLRDAVIEGEMKRRKLTPDSLAPIER